MQEVKQSTATWCVTIPALNVYEHREGSTHQAMSKAIVIAMEHQCVPCTSDPWSLAEPWAYERRIKLPRVLVPERTKHSLVELLKCWRGKRCRHCDDEVRLLTIPGETSQGAAHQMALPIRIPGRRTLLERNRLGEYGAVRIALVFDLMMGIAPDPNAVEEWKAAGGVSTGPRGKSAPEPNTAQQRAL